MKELKFEDLHDGDIIKLRKDILKHKGYEDWSDMLNIEFVAIQSKDKCTFTLYEKGTGVFGGCISIGAKGRQTEPCCWAESYYKVNE